MKLCDCHFGGRVELLRSGRGRRDVQWFSGCWEGFCEEKGGNWAGGVLLDLALCLQTTEGGKEGNRKRLQNTHPQHYLQRRDSCISNLKPKTRNNPPSKSKSGDSKK